MPAHFANAPYLAYVPTVPFAARMPVIYDPSPKPSPKHCEPITAERPGSKCPSWSVDIAQALLDGSVLVGGKRFATRDGVAFVGQLTRLSDRGEIWHGYPEAWDRIPLSVKAGWKAAGLVRRRDFRRLKTRKDVVAAFGGKM